MTPKNIVKVAFAMMLLGALMFASILVTVFLGAAYYFGLVNLETFLRFLTATIILNVFGLILNYKIEQKIHKAKPT